MLLGKPVSHENYISRSDLDDELANLIFQGRDIDLIGPNRMGKTAVCHHLIDNLRKSGKFETRYIDLLHLRSPRICNSVSRITDSRVNSSGDTRLDDFVGANEVAVDELIKFASKLSKPLVIILDEMDAGLSKKGIYHEWNASLRLIESKLHESGEGNILFVVVYATPPDFFHEMHNEFSISTRIGRGHIKYMPSLNKVEASAYFNKIAPPDNPINADFAIKYAGAHPFLIDCLAYESHRFCDSESQNYRTMLENVYQQSESYYKDLFDFVLRKDNYWKTYASSVLSCGLEQVNSYDRPNANDKKFHPDEMEIRELTELGILQKGGDGRLELFSPLFAWWISRNASQILAKDETLSKRMIDYFGTGDLKTLLGNIKNSQAIAGGIAKLLQLE